jgi:outer membrane protein assembly factor BamD
MKLEYKKAIRLLREPAYRGKPQAEKLFHVSQAYYKTEQYYLAGYQFEFCFRIS